MSDLALLAHGILTPAEGRIIFGVLVGLGLLALSAAGGLVYGVVRLVRWWLG